MFSLRKFTITMVTAALAVGAAAATADPAAASSSSTVNAAHWAYTDAAAPFTSHVDGPGGLPIGVWRDSAHHVHLSRAYYTFNLSSFTGSYVMAASLEVDEFAVNDCTATTIVGVFQAAAFTRPTWAHPPAEQRQLVGLPNHPATCPGHESWDITSAVDAAVTAGAPTLTIELRVPSGSELDPRYGRRFSSAAALSVISNKAPVLANLRVDGSPCGTQPVYTSNPSPTVSVDVVDPDDVQSRVAFQIGQTSFSSGGGEGSWTASATAPGALASGTYPLSATPVDPLLVRPPGQPVSCQLVVDRDAPVAAPTVSSDVYLQDAPHGGVGVVGDFTFDAHGDTDVVGFRWGVLPDGPTIAVPANQPGGTATVQWTPTAFGDAHLVVVGVDRVGNVSPQGQYDFVVAGSAPVSTAPTIEDHNPDAAFGQPRTITFHPNMPGVTSYVYTFHSPTPRTVAADPDGTATVVLVFDQAGGNDLYVYSLDAAGTRSDTARVNIQPRSSPTVTSTQYPTGGVVGAPAGTPGQFVVTSFVPGVVSYNYQFDKGTKVTAPTDANGNLTITLTPSTPGPHTLVIGFGTLADGRIVDGTAYTFIAG